MKSLTRRAFFSAAGIALGMSAFGGAVVVSADADGILRPPVVLDERRFSSLCLRCYRCIEACPTHALVPAGLGDGLLAARTPKFDFRLGACVFCNKCVDVCPIGALLVADPHDPSSGRIGVAVVQPDRCVAFYNGCRECFRQCPFQAIALDASGFPVVDEAKCNGCGVCEHICPALVYRSFSGGTRRGIVVTRAAVPPNTGQSPLREGGRHG